MVGFLLSSSRIALSALLIFLKTFLENFFLIKLFNRAFVECILPYQNSASQTVARIIV